MIVSLLAMTGRCGEPPQKRGAAVQALLYGGRKTIIVAALALSLASCSSTPVSKTNALDARLDWPCNRLVLEWPLDARDLQKTAGQNMTVRRTDGIGQLQLQVMHCQPLPPANGDAGAASYAFVLIPVERDNAPIAVTRVPPDGWFWLGRVMADAESRGLFANFGYDVRMAHIDFATNRTGEGTNIAVRLKFETGCIAIDASTDGHPSDYDSQTAFLAGGDSYASAYFGKETTRRFAAKATIRIVGETALPGSLGAPAAAWFDRGLVASRVYWRIASP